MAESMVGLKRSHRCTEVSSADIGKKVTVMGWVAKRRNLGALIFVDLRDRSGIPPHQRDLRIRMPSSCSHYSTYAQNSKGFTKFF